MKKNTVKTICILTVALLFSVIVAVSIAGCSAKNAADDSDIQYVLYLGTNHKDTNQPVFTPEEAKEHAIEILLKHFGGYTIQEANGGWKDGETVYTEYTLVIYLSDTTIEKVHEACDEMIEVFCQTSVLIQANHTKTEFYSGAAK